ncbi:3-oxoacyl-ACP reductase [Chromatiales bacterium (ex Bugula neritina AB1)]|nr:3-oxoacyl-ACP reductase [Chromatiales bacterium (ex Bugula neritina AB1)]
MSNTRVALITGATSGIGKSTAQAFMQAGYRVAVTGRREQLLNDLIADVPSSDALACPADLTDSSAVDTLFENITSKFGQLDVVFNNAGNNVAAKPIGDISVEDWKKVVDVNLTGAFLIARGAFNVMRAQTPQGGRIINNGSISAQVPRPGSAPYTSTKHAITGLTRTVSLDGRPFNIACGQIDIGNAASEMTERMRTGVPQANGAIEVEPVMDVENVSRAVIQMADLPLDVNVQFITIMATAMPFIGRG